MLNVTKEKNGTEMTMILEGKVDTATAPQLSDEIAKIMDEVDVLILDLEKVEYVSSAGLRVFLATDQDMDEIGKHAKLKNVPESVMDIFDMTGFTEALDII